MSVSLTGNERACPLSVDRDVFYMQQALKEAGKAFEENEVPIGAVIVYQDKIIGRAHNQIEMLRSPTAHAEIIAIIQAASLLGNKWLREATAYVTIEPCLMCAGAFVLARIEKIIYGADDPKTGAFGSRLDVNGLRLNHKIKIKNGVLEKECAHIVRNFFRIRR